jgi:predicted O-methyltransferase YrrM
MQRAAFWYKKMSNHNGNTHKAAIAGEIIARLANDGFTVAALDGKQHDLFPVAIDPKEGEALQGWIKKENPASVIDIGLGYGFAVMNTIKALIECRGEDFLLLTIDPFQDTGFSNIGLQFINEIGVNDQTEFHKRPSELVLPELQQQGRKFDFAVVDGTHRFEGAFIDLFYLNSLMAPSSVIFLDDYQIAGVRKAVTFFISNMQWALEEISEPSETHQWAAVRTRHEPLQRTYKDFVDF